MSLSQPLFFQHEVVEMTHEDTKRIKQIDPQDCRHRTISDDQILRWFEMCDGAWMHDGDPNKPHAELSSGLCSNGFFECQAILEHPNLNEILAYQLYKKLVENGVEKVDWVIGSPYAAITFSYEIAKAFGAVHGFAEKDPSNSSGKKMVWRRRTIPESAIVLQIEELITTSNTFREVRRAIEEGNKYSVNFISVVGALVHRPSKLPARYGDRKVVALVEREVWAVEPSECLLCDAGSERVRPKSNWEELTGK